MPVMKETGRPDPDELPGTLKRSPTKAQRTYAKAHDAAVEQYDGDEERAHRTAWAAVKHTYQKVDDHWEQKRHPGPSDPRSEGTTAQKRAGRGETYGGVDARGSTRAELLGRAQRLGVRGRSRMTKDDLAREIARRQG